MLFANRKVVKTPESVVWINRANDKSDILLSLPVFANINDNTKLDDRKSERGQTGVVMMVEAGSAAVRTRRGHFQVLQ